MDRLDPLISIGTSGWMYPHWKGVFYPADLPQNRWLASYQENFNTVEINATFYRQFSDPTFLKWKQQAAGSFRYSLKIPKRITHQKQLVNCQVEIRQMDQSAALLGDHFGMFLLQIAPTTPVEASRLREALLAFENPQKVAVEFRSAAWDQPDIRNLLEEIGAVRVNVDSPLSRLVDWTTGQAAYLRLHGRRRWYADFYTTDELHEIAHLVEKLASHDTRQIYLYFNNDFQGYAPHNALQLKEMLQGQD